MNEKGLPSTLISLAGIRASGRHGANPGERAQAQEFVVDLSVWVHTGKDRLEETVDYRDIVRTAREVIASKSFILLETLAEAVADSVIALGDIGRVTAVIHKLGAAESLGVGDVSAEATVDE